MFSLINHLFFKKISLIILFSLQTALVYSGSLDYQPRGDRWEGIAPNPVSGLDIELLSALVDYNEMWQPLPMACKLKFYLPKSTEVDLTVRELRPKHYYKMDRVLPKSRWQNGVNHYQWSTGDVISALNLNIPKLGIVARLTKTASSAEQVAPVVLYHSNMPKSVNGYLFAFKVGGSAKLKYAIYQGNSENPTATGDLGKQSVGEPFIVYWNSANVKEGPYELIVDGHFLENFLPIHQSVRFYHKPALK